MMLYLLIGMIGAAAALAFKNWRWGIAAAIAIGMIQDPIRKMIPGTPAWLTMASLPVWGVAILMALTESRNSTHRFMRNFPRLSYWIQAFSFYLVIAAALSATYGPGTWMITLLGAAIYLSAFFMIVAGWRLSDSGHSLIPLLAFYGILAGVFLIGGPLERMGWAQRTAVIGTEALGHVWVTHRVGDAVYMLSGLFRSPDIMGWHAVTCFMISVIMALRTKGYARAAWILLGVWALISLWLCGRRKMLAMIPIFFGTFMVLTFHLRQARNVIPIIGVILLLLGVGWQMLGAERSSPVATFYLTTLDEWDDRVVQHGFRAVLVTVRQAGFWGYGLGMGQQGVHNIPVVRPRTWQESGPSKLFAELGVPGSFLFLVLGVIFLRTCYDVLRVNRNHPDFYIYLGLFAALIANLASAVVSAQIYGDPFIVLFISLIIGLILSGGKPRVVKAARESA